MCNHPTDHPFECLTCGVAGRLPLADGDTLCPRCGEHLWTVRSVTSPPPGEIGPVAGIAILRGRPPLRRKPLRLARFCVVIFWPILYLWLVPRQHAAETRVNEKLDQIADCHDRDQLEALLGSPLYAVAGEAAGAQGLPDVIECYESEGCCIDLWFKGDRLVDVSGFVKPTIWDLALNKSRQTQ